MLRSYAMSVRLFGKRPFSADEATALLNIFSCVARQATIVLPQADVTAVPDLLGPAALSNNAKRLQDLFVEQFKAPRRDDRLVLLQTAQSQDPVDDVRFAAERVGFHGVLVRERTRLPAALRDFPLITLQEASQELERSGQSRRLFEFRTRKALDAFLAPFFWRDHDIVIVDPYLGAKACRHSAELRAAGTAIARIVALSMRCPLVKRQRRRVIVITDSIQTCRTGKKCGVSSPSTAAKQRLEAAVRSAIDAAGGPADGFEVVIRYCEDFAIRGIISSGRVWHIEHEIEDLYRAIQRVENGGRPSATRRHRMPTVALHETTRAADLRRIVYASKVHDPPRRRVATRASRR